MPIDKPYIEVIYNKQKQDEIESVFINNHDAIIKIENENF